MKEVSMKKALIFAAVVVVGLSWGCAGERGIAKSAPVRILPVDVRVDSVERLNAIAAKPPFQATDVLVFRVTFMLTNPNQALARIDDLYCEVKIDDGTREKMIVLAGSMPSQVILGGGEMLWSITEPLLYGGLTGQIVTRGVGGPEGMKGVLAKRDEIWTDLGADNKNFLIEGNVTTSSPEFPQLGTIREQFKMEFTIPKL
jgi:hypothetical protein